MAITTKPLTYEEWLNMPEVHDAIEEVVNGEIVKMPPPKGRHGDVVESLYDILNSQVDRASVRIRISSFGLIIRKDPLQVRIPDLAMFHRANVVEENGYIH